jgi:trehalose 6-phosphate phosphatase
MKNILVRANRAVLERYASSNMLLALDYDGTLAPIVADRASAAMRPRTARLLEVANRLYPVVIISGRSRADVLARLRAAGVREVIGNHGAEPSHGSDAITDDIERWRQRLQERLAPWRGVEIESKRYSLAIHYRRARAKKPALAAILEAAGALTGARLVGGKLVVNLLPERGPHKGMALERERERLRCDTSIYVGDDDTDEDVFSLDQPGQLLGVRVGRREGSAASYCISGQQHIDDLLVTLVALRERAVFRSAAAR